MALFDVPTVVGGSPIPGYLSCLVSCFSTIDEIHGFVDGIPFLFTSFGVYLYNRSCTYHTRRLDCGRHPWLSRAPPLLPPVGQVSGAVDQRHLWLAGDYTDHARETACVLYQTTSEIWCVAVVAGVFQYG